MRASVRVSPRPPPLESAAPDVAVIQSERQEAAQPTPAEHHTTFHDVLSALNPLQYLPVIGTIYRAVTGDQIPDFLRRIGSLVVSTLIGGPIGAVTNIAMLMAEKATGIDMDKAGQALLNGNGVGTPSVVDPAPGPGPTSVAHGGAVAPPAASPTEPWSPAQLAAYGVSSSQDGTLKLANLSGADVLNSLELARIQDVQVAYGGTAKAGTSSQLQVVL